MCNNGEPDKDWLQFCRHFTAVSLYNVCLEKCNLHLPRIKSILNKWTLLVMTAAIWFAQASQAYAFGGIF